MSRSSQKKIRFSLKIKINRCSLEHLTSLFCGCPCNTQSLQEMQKRSLTVISEVEAKVKIQHEESSKVLAQRTSEVMSLRNDISRHQREHALLDQQLKGALKDKEVLELNAASRWCC